MRVTSLVMPARVARSRSRHPAASLAGQVHESVGQTRMPNEPVRELTRSRMPPLNTGWRRLSARAPPSLTQLSGSIGSQADHRGPAVGSIIKVSHRRGAWPSQPRHTSHQPIRGLQRPRLPLGVRADPVHGACSRPMACPATPQLTQCLVMLINSRSQAPSAVGLRSESELSRWTRSAVIQRPASLHRSLLSAKSPFESELARCTGPVVTQRPAPLHYSLLSATSS